MCSLLCIVSGLLLGWVSLMIGFGLGFLILSSVLEVVVGSVEAWYTSALDIKEVLAGVVDSDVHLYVADVVKSFDTVDRGVLDRVLSSLGLPGWFRHDYFEYHAHVRLRFKLASGLGVPWTRDGGIPQGCPLSMMFIVALYLPWCRYLAAQEEVQLQLYADNLKCLCLGILVCSWRAARFTTGYVRLVGQEPAPSKCVLLSTSREVRKRYERIGPCPMVVISGLSSLMFGIWEGIWILLFVGGLLLWLLGFVWSFLDLVLIFALSSGFSR